MASIRRTLEILRKALLAPFRPAARRWRPHAKDWMKLEALIRKAAAIEPAIIAPHTNPAAYPSHRSPIPDAQNYKLVRGLATRLGAHRFDTVFLLSEWRRGGAEREAMQILSALKAADAGHRILVLVTDSGGTEAIDWAPDEATATIATFDAYATHCTPEKRAWVLAHILATYEPARVINCNSNAGWLAYERHGARLARHTRLETMLFCYDYDRAMNRCGYAPRFLRSCLPHLAAIYVDNQQFIDDLARDYGLPENFRRKFFCLYQPAPASANVVPRAALLARLGSNPHGAKPRVLWAGRPTAQKRVDLLMQIARAVPDAEFYCAGGSRAEFLRNSSAAKAPENIRFLGRYANFHDLGLRGVTAFLHTAAWEGLPNVLLEAMAAGLPVVASDTGGVRELVDHETGWLIGAPFSPDAYAHALREIFTSAAAVERKLSAADRRLALHHAPDVFLNRLEDLGLLQRRES